MSPFPPQTLRQLRESALRMARVYRDDYRREHFGMQRRMMGRMLALALEYRRELNSNHSRKAA